MNTSKNIERFEAELSRVNRQGIQKVLEYCRSSDMYSAPASTRYHLSVSGGLLQHSLNMLDCLRSMLTDNGDGTYSFTVGSASFVTVSEESVIISALLHDICKTNCYQVEKRNRKVNGEWEQYDAYTVSDSAPLGHGEKSVMMLQQLGLVLKPCELYAIRWHMGPPQDTAGINTFGSAVAQYPFTWVVHSADMIVSRLVEGEGDNKKEISVLIS